MDRIDYSRIIDRRMLEEGPEDRLKHSLEEGEQLLAEIRYWEKKNGRITTIEGRRNELRRILIESGADPAVCRTADTPKLKQLVGQFMLPARVIRKNLYGFLFRNSSLFYSPGDYIERLVDVLGDQALFREGDSLRLRIVKQFLEYAPYQTTSVISAVLKQNGKEKIRAAEKRRQTALSLIDESIFDSMEDDFKWDLLHLADDLANGKFRTQGRTRRHLYLFAFAFGLYVLDPEDLEEARETRSDLRLRDLEQNLLYDFFNASFVQMMSEVYQNDPQAKAGYDMYPTGAGINYKNWLEAVFLYYIHLNHQLIEEGAPSADRRELFIRMIRMEEACKPGWGKMPAFIKGSKACSSQVSFLAMEPGGQRIPGVRVRIEKNGEDQKVFTDISADGKGGALTLEAGKYTVTTVGQPADCVSEDPFVLTVVGDGSLGAGYEVLKDPDAPVPVFLVPRASADEEKGFPVGFRVLDLNGTMLDKASFTVWNKNKIVLTAHAVVGSRDAVTGFLKPGTYRVEAGDLPEDRVLEGARELRVTKTGRVFVNNACCPDGVVTLETRPLMTEVYRDRYQELLGQKEEDLPEYLMASYVMSEKPASAGYITVREDQAAATRVFRQYMEKAIQYIIEWNGDDEDLAYGFSLKEMQEGLREDCEYGLRKSLLEAMPDPGMREAVEAFNRAVSQAKKKRAEDMEADLQAEEENVENRNYQGNTSKAGNKFTKSIRTAREKLLGQALTLAEGTAREGAVRTIAAEYRRIFDALDRFNDNADKMKGFLQLGMDGKNRSGKDTKSREDLEYREDLIRALWINFRFEQSEYGMTYQDVFYDFQEYCAPVLRECRYAPLEMRNLFDAFAVLMLYSLASLQDRLESRLQD